MKEIILGSGSSTSPKIVDGYIRLEDLNTHHLIVLVIIRSNSDTNIIKWLDLFTVHDGIIHGFEQRIEANRNDHFHDVYTGLILSDALCRIKAMYNFSEFYLIDNWTDFNQIWKRIPQLVGEHTL